MSFLKSLWSDLVERRLWPVAVVLLVALVAVPALLGRGGDATQSAALTSATGPTGAAAALGPPTADVTLLAPGPVRRNRDGTLRDPFAPHGAAAAVPATGPTGLTGAPGSAAGTPASPSAAGAGSASPSGAASGSGSATGGAAGPDGPQSATTPPAATPVPKGITPAAPAPSPFVAEVRIGPSGSKRTAKDVARLAPLPSTDAPFLIFIGVLGDKRTAVFLLSNDVTATGDGSCRPSKASCQTVELRAGDSEKLVVSAGSGKARTYDLDLLGVRRADSAKVSAAAPQPRKVARRAPGAGAEGYRFDGRVGLLSREALLAFSGRVLVPHAALLP